MNLVDSSGWLEYVADGPNAAFFAKPIEQTDELIVSTINLYEVFKRIAQQRDLNAGLEVVAAMRQGTVVEVSQAIALAAGRLSLETKLPMADSLILATARMHGATLWTQDADFDGLESVQYVQKR